MGTSMSNSYTSSLVEAPPRGFMGTSCTVSLASSPRNAGMLLLAARTRLGQLIETGQIRPDKRQLRALMMLLLQLVESGGPLPQVAPTISGGIEVQWLVGSDFVGLIADQEGEWLLWTESSSGGFEIEGAYGELIPPNHLVGLRNQLRQMGRSARYWL